MPEIKLIGRSVLGDLGFCQSVSKMGSHYDEQLQKIRQQLPKGVKLITTAMLSSKLAEESNFSARPVVRLYTPDTDGMFDPYQIYRFCQEGLDLVRPAADFVVYNPKLSGRRKLAIATFSREAPILVFYSSNGSVAIGTILRKSLLKYGRQLFKNVQTAMGEGEITVNLVTSTFFEYEEGTIDDQVMHLIKTFRMNYYCDFIKSNVNQNPECYHRGEVGNHVVVVIP